MHRLSNKRVLVGVTGGIAAYKAAELIRCLRRHGAETRVVMTAGACEFITPLTLQALSGNPVHTSLLDPEAEAGMGHIELARWADVIMIAPATADFIAQLTTGQGKDLLSAICLATHASIYLAPAMNQGMWEHKATQQNIACLRQRGVTLFGPDKGAQACGETGYGRMLEPEAIAHELAQTFHMGLLSGRRVLITAGPTREAIDPVRYISNHSSGKMGFSLARAAVDAGAAVTLVTGPVSLVTPDRVHRINVESAEEMYQSVLRVLGEAEHDIFIGSAAISDYRPANAATCKIKKDHHDTNEKLLIELIRNPDVLMSVARLEEGRPFTVGFAAETRNVLLHAREKMKNKSLDMIIANDVGNSTIGFNSDDNAVSVLWGEEHLSFPVMSKLILARKLIAHIAGVNVGKGAMHDMARPVKGECI